MEREVNDREPPFDELFDTAYCEIRVLFRELEAEGEIEPDLSCQDTAYQSKKLAAEFMEVYREMNEDGYPDFYDELDKFATERLKKTYPPLKRYDVMIDIPSTACFQTWATDEKDAERDAERFIQSEKFKEWFVKNMTMDMKMRRVFPIGDNRKE